MGVPPLERSREWGSVLSACRAEALVLDVLGFSPGAASGGTSHALKAVGERARRRDGANIACRGTSWSWPGLVLTHRSPPGPTGSA